MTPTVIVLAVILVWFTYRLARSPGDLALRAVVAALALRMLGQPAVAMSLPSLTGDALAPTAAKLVQNLGLCGSWYSLILFFLFSATGVRTGAPVRPRVGRRAWSEAVILLLVGGAMTAAVISTPVQLRSQAYPQNGALRVPLLQVSPVALFYVVGSAYFCYAAVIAARWAWRYAAESSTRARWGLRTAAAGIVLFAFAAGGRGLVTGLRWSGADPSASVATVFTKLVPAATALFIAGVVFVGLAARVAALRVWIRHRRTYHALHPLWVALHAVFPDDALDRRPRSLARDWISPRRVHRRYWRRVVECRDGLVQLSPHLGDVGFDSGHQAVEQAGALREALRRQRDEVRASSSTAVLIAAPASADLDADVDQLVRLSRALKDNG